MAGQLDARYGNLTWNLTSSSASIRRRGSNTGSVALFVLLMAILFYGERRTEDEEDHLYVHAVVCAIAGSMYFAMANGVASVVLETGREYTFGRYLDWSFTTPLLLYGLGLTAMHGSISRKGVMIAIVVFDVLMIGTCLALGFLPNEMVATKVAWWVLGCVFFFGVLYLIWTTLREESEKRGPVVAEVFKRNAGIITVLWTIYAFVILVGYNCLGWLGSAQTAGCIVILDVLAKGVYGLISVQGTKRIVEAEREGKVRDPATSARPGPTRPVTA